MAVDQPRHDDPAAAIHHIGSAGRHIFTDLDHNSSLDAHFLTGLQHADLGFEK